MGDRIDRDAAIQAVFDWEQGKISGTIADAIAALPAASAEDVRAGALKEAAAIIGKHKHHWEDAQRHVLALIPEAKP